MSEANKQARIEAFRENLTVDGEELILLNGLTTVATVTGLVDRGFAKTKLAPHQVDYTERNSSVIEVLRVDLESVEDQIKIGLTWKDGDDHHHRIESVRRTDVVFRFECETDPEDLE